jgi:hypothetical protein
MKCGYPFPGLREQFFRLNGKKIFSQIDLNSGYHQIRMKNEDVYKTAFTLPFGHYEYLRMPFGLSDAQKLL